MSSPGTTLVRPGPEAGRSAGPHWNRLVVGLLLLAVGVAWLLDTAGVAVPWHLAPSTGLIVVGLALLASLAGGRGRGGLFGIGIVLLAVALAVALDVDRYAGPAGDVDVRPTPTGWPSTTTLSAGSVRVDLTAAALPAAGRLDVRVGAGRVEVRVPAGHPVRVEADVVIGTVVVDAKPAVQGVDQHWSDPAGATAPVAVHVQVGAGEVEVHHDAA
jgi:hypothetical protein